MSHVAEIDGREPPAGSASTSNHETLELQVGDAAAMLQAAVTYLAANRAREALLAASEACHAAPNLAEAHYAYG